MGTPKGPGKISNWKWKELGRDLNCHSLRSLESDSSQVNFLLEQKPILQKNKAELWPWQCFIPNVQNTVKNY